MKGVKEHESESFCEEEMRALQNNQKEKESLRRLQG